MEGCGDRAPAGRTRNRDVGMGRQALKASYEGTAGTLKNAPYVAQPFRAAKTAGVEVQRASRRGRRGQVEVVSPHYRRHARASAVS